MLFRGRGEVGTILVIVLRYFFLFHFIDIFTDGAESWVGHIAGALA